MREDELYRLLEALRLTLEWMTLINNSKGEKMSYIENWYNPMLYYLRLGDGCRECMCQMHQMLVNWVSAWVNGAGNRTAVSQRGEQLLLLLWAEQREEMPCGKLHKTCTTRSSYNAERTIGERTAVTNTLTLVRGTSQRSIGPKTHCKQTMI